MVALAAFAKLGSSIPQRSFRLHLIVIVLASLIVHFLAETPNLSLTQTSLFAPHSFLELFVYMRILSFSFFIPSIAN